METATLELECKKEPERIEDTSLADRTPIKRRPTSKSRKLTRIYRTGLARELNELYSEHYSEASSYNTAYCEGNPGLMKELVDIAGARGKSNLTRIMMINARIERANLSDYDKEFVGKMLDTYYEQVHKTAGKNVHIGKGKKIRIGTSKQVKDIVNVLKNIRNSRHLLGNYKQGLSWQEYEPILERKEWLNEIKYLRYIDGNAYDPLAGFRNRKAAEEGLEEEGRPGSGKRRVDYLLHIKERRMAREEADRKFGNRLAAGFCALGLVGSLLFYEMGAKEAVSSAWKKTREFASTIWENFTYRPPTKVASKAGQDNTTTPIAQNKRIRDSEVITPQFEGYDRVSLKTEEGSPLTLIVDGDLTSKRE